jgi:hypothetical protein
MLINEKKVRAVAWISVALASLASACGAVAQAASTIRSVVPSIASSGRK